MAIDKRQLVGGLDRDTDERLVKEGNYRYALNVRNMTSDGDDIGTIQNILGNTLITNSDLPTSGVNRAIGFCEDSEDNSIYYFVYNSLENHGIYRFNTVTQEVTTVLQNKVLNFNPAHPIHSSNVVIIRHDSKDESGINNELSEEQRLLYFTDNFNPPRKINIKKAIIHTAAVASSGFDSDGFVTGGYSQRLNDGSNNISNVNNVPERDIYVDAVKYAPHIRPSVETDRDNSVDYNNINDILFQFKYRYVYDDNEKSAFSPISDVVIAKHDKIDRVLSRNQYTTLENRIKVTVTNSVDTIKKIEIVFRKGNDGVFFLAEEVDNDSSWFDEAGATPSTQTINFYNDGLYPAIDEVDDVKLFDNLPLLAETQDIASNRMMYANYVEGFNLIPTQNTTPAVTVKDKFNVRLTNKYNPMSVNADANTMHLPFAGELNSPVSGTFGGNNATGSLTLDFSGINLVAGVTIVVSFGASGQATYEGPGIGGGHIGGNNPIISANPTTQVDYYAELEITESNLTSFDTAAEVAAYFVTQLSAQAPSGWEITSPGASMVVKVPVLLNGVLQTITSIGYLGYNNSTAFTNTGNFFTRSFKSGASHKFGIVYYDKANRSSFVNTSTDASSYVQSLYQRIPFDDTNNNYGAVDIFNHIMHTPPEWATHYQWVYTGNTTVNDFIQCIISRRFVDKDNNVYLGLRSFKATSEETDAKSLLDSLGSIIDFSPAKGDRIKMLTYLKEGGSQNQNAVNGDEFERARFNYNQDFPIVEDMLTNPTIYLEDDNQVIYETTLEGFYIKIQPPENLTYLAGANVNRETSNADMSAAATGGSGAVDGGEISFDNILQNGFAGRNRNSNAEDRYLNSLVQIYRPKKGVVGDPSQLYYEIGDVLEVGDPGQASRYHKGMTGYRDQNTHTGTTANKTVQAYESDYGYLKFSVTTSDASDLALQVGDLIIISSASSTGHDTLLNTTHVVADSGTTVGGNKEYKTFTYFSGTTSGTLGVVRRVRAAGGVFTNTGDVYLRLRAQVMGGAQEVLDVSNGSLVNGVILQNASSSSNINYQNAVTEPYSKQLRLHTIEDYNASDFFVSNSYDKGRLHPKSEFARRVRKQASVTYSETFTTNTTINGLSSFNITLVNFKNFNTEFGSIQKINGRQGTLTLFQENKSSTSLIEKSIINTADGGALVGLSKNILSEQEVYQGDYGICQNPESHVSYGFRDYFVDIKRGAVIRLSANGLEKISDAGMKDYFRDISEELMTKVNHLKIFGGYDSRYDEYIISFQEILFSFLVTSSGKTPVDGGGEPLPIPIVQMMAVVPDNSHNEHRSNNLYGEEEDIRKRNRKRRGADSRRSNKTSDIRNVSLDRSGEDIIRDGHIAIRANFRADSTQRDDAHYISSGTLSVNKNNTSVTGSSTKFLTEVEVGDFLFETTTISDSNSFLNGRKITTTNNIGKVASITSDTAITLDSNYLGENLSGKTVQVVKGTYNQIKTNPDNSISLNDTIRGEPITVPEGQIQAAKSSGNSTFPVTMNFTDSTGTAQTFDGVADFSDGSIIFNVPGTVSDTSATIRIDDLDIVKGDTLSFSELTKKWVSFYSYSPDSFGKLNSRMYTCSHGNLYIHDDNETRNEFYGTHYVSQLHVISNPEPSKNKVYSAISIEGNSAWSVVDLFTNLTTSEFDIIGFFALSQNDGAFGENVKGVGEITTAPGDATVTGTNTEFTTSLVVGDVLHVAGNQLGIVESIASDTSLELDNALSAATGFGYAQSVFSDWAEKEGMFYASLKHGGSIQTAGGTVSDNGTNLFGLGNVSITSGSTTLTGTNLDLLLKVGDIIAITNAELQVGVVSSVDSSTQATLANNYLGPTLTNQFAFVRAPDMVEGDRFSGYYLRANLENVSTEAVELYAVNFYVTASELSNR